MTICFTVTDCSLGRVLVAATNLGLCAMLLGDDDAALMTDLGRRFPRAQLRPGDANFEALLPTAMAVVDGVPGASSPPLDLIGTSFQALVWQALRGVVPGNTTTYSNLAAAVGKPAAVRAVAQACGANPIAIAIPCHRVVRSDGALAGYRWGLERKRALLAREQHARR